MLSGYPRSYVLKQGSRNKKRHALQSLAYFGLKLNSHLVFCYMNHRQKVEQYLKLFKNELSVVL